MVVFAFLHRHPRIDCPVYVLAPFKYHYVAGIFGAMLQCHPRIDSLGPRWASTLLCSTPSLCYLAVETVDDHHRSPK